MSIQPIDLQGMTSGAVIFPQIRMTDLGMQLQAARLAKGYAIADLAAITRIRAPYLVALEEGHYDQLPGRSCALGFAKNIAREIGLDPIEIAQKFSFETAAMEPSQPHPMFLKIDKAGQPRLPFLAAAAALAVACLVLWKVVTPGQAHAPDMVQQGVVEDVPERMIHSASARARQADARESAATGNWNVQQQPLPLPELPHQLASFTVR